MSHSFRLKETALAPASVSGEYPSSPNLQPLDGTHRNEVLAFLTSCSIETLLMRGLICDNGMESGYNRGTFYGCRDHEGRLTGVALIGHATLVEAHSESVLAAFARLAKAAHAHVIIGHQEKVESFWTHYEAGGQEPRRICRELFMEQREPIETLTEATPLRLATLDDLEKLITINAGMACAESGINPLEVDPEGFRERVVRRVEMKRIYVWSEGERLIFKADIMAEVPGITYLEGVYVHPQERGKGYGARAMAQLGRQLLARTEALCLLVNEQNKDAQLFFFKAGYKLRACYDTIFLQPRADETH